MTHTVSVRARAHCTYSYGCFSRSRTARGEEISRAHITNRLVKSPDRRALRTSRGGFAEAGGANGTYQHAKE